MHLKMHALKNIHSLNGEIKSVCQICNQEFQMYFRQAQIATYNLDFTHPQTQLVITISKLAISPQNLQFQSPQLELAILQLQL